MRDSLPACDRPSIARSHGIDANVPVASSTTRRRFCMLSAAALVGLSTNSSLAASGVRTRDVGELRLTTMSDGHFDLPLTRFPNAPDIVDRRPVRVGANAWVIETPTRLVLVDAGSGAAMQQLFPDTGRLADRLTAGGVSAQDVTDIILTHMHTDHIGGLMVNGVPRFPNATVHIAEADWAFWMDPGRTTQVPRNQLSEAVLVVQLAKALNYDVMLHSGQVDLGEGIIMEPAPGHTPGHMVVRLDSGGQQAMILSDAMICGPMQMAYPEVTYMLDVDPIGAAEFRRRCFDMLATDGIPFTSTHLNTMALGNVGRFGTGFSFHPA